MPGQSFGTRLNQLKAREKSHPGLPHPHCYHGAAFCDKDKMAAATPLFDAIPFVSTQNFQVFFLPYRNLAKIIISNNSSIINNKPINYCILECAHPSFYSSLRHCPLWLSKRWQTSSMSVTDDKLCSELEH